MAGRAPDATPQLHRRRTRGDAVRRLLERLFLGAIMSLIALVIDRRLRRAFRR
ncbi:MAG TPA: hypothetical protein VJU79_08410 [Candidatus Dormibacteraeota bacterium]|nr:hypothetical protein [Candidatus Dormibacteraeota bacterium]